MNRLKIKHSASVDTRYFLKEPKKICRSCGEKIPLLAKKCRFCNSYQDWRKRLHFSQSVLALLVALVSTISLSIPILQDLWTPDDSELVISYVDEPDIGIKVIISNKGTRPAYLSSKAGLKIVTKNEDGKLIEHAFLLSSSPSSRGELFVSENSSKLFLYAVDMRQPIGDEFEKFYRNLNGLTNLEKCVFYLGYNSFRGNRINKEIVIFQKAGEMDYSFADQKNYYQIMSALECLGKIPQPIREQFQNN